MIGAHSIALAASTVVAGASNSRGFPWREGWERRAAVGGEAAAESAAGTCDPGERDLRILEVEVARPRPERERPGCLQLDLDDGSWDRSLDREAVRFDCPARTWNEPVTASADSLREAFASGLDASASVRVRRPGSLFQVELPAFMSDGDAAAIFVRPSSAGSLVVTDLGSTRTRLSYERELSAEIDDELARLAELQGLRVEGGEIQVEVAPSELLAAALGLLQVEAQAERIAFTAPRRAREAAKFRKRALELLHEIFGAHLREPYFDEKSDPDGLFQVDALVEGRKPLAIALVPNDVDAERAVGAKLALSKLSPPRTRWIAIPRDVERLTSKTRKRLLREYLSVGAAFEEDRGIVEERLRDLAEVA